MENKGKTALITGATQGIGHFLAHECAEDGYNLIIVARDETELAKNVAHFKKKFGVEVRAISKDLMEPSAAEELYEELGGIQIDVLINDAGQGVWGKFAETDMQRELDIIQLNINSLVVLTKLVLKDMVARGSGKILQLASMVSKSPSPLMAVYAGTKAFVYNFTQSVINELKDTGVTMTALLPGATDTDFFNKADAENTVTVQEEEMMDPADVAKEGYAALKKGDSKVIAGLKNKTQAAMGNFMPDEAVAAQMRKKNEVSTAEHSENDTEAQVRK